MTSTVYHWNDDKPHRCPDCHRVWDWDFRMKSRIRKNPFSRKLRYHSNTWPIPQWTQPQWWRTNTCEYCGTRFSGRARKECP